MAAILNLYLTGGATNSDPNASLGGTRSSTQVSSTALNNIFDNVQPDEATNGDTEYRAIAIVNDGDATATSVALYMSNETSSADTQLDFGSEGVDPASPITIADESTAPTGITFGHYNSSNKLSLPDIPAGSECRIWIKRTVAAGAINTGNDQGTIAIDYA